MLPVLKSFSEGDAETPLKEVRKRVAAAEQLTEDDLAAMLPSGTQRVFNNRVAWAVIYLERAGLLMRVRRGVYRMAPEGEQVLGQAPTRIDMEFLGRFPAYAAWRKAGNKTQTKEQNGNKATKDSAETPEEALESAAQQLRDALELDLLKRVRSSEPAFLEQVVLDLLVAMGYGGGDPSMGRITGRSGDGGIDGTIREDTLGLDEVYVQAKKYAADNTVGASALRNFAGAIDAAGTSKGVFVTTARFTQAARQYVALSPKRIVLIDGEELARLMVTHNIGVRTRVTHEIKRIDEDYFSEETQ